MRALPIAFRWLVIAQIALLALASCQAATPSTAATKAPGPVGGVEQPVLLPREEGAPRSAVEPTASSSAPDSPAPTAPVEGQAAVANPLTGLPVESPELLCHPPLLVAISNFPPSARPQSGLSAAAQVWETFIGEGMTRFLAIFYGDYRRALQAAQANRLEPAGHNGMLIGPVRSGRVVFEEIKALFPRGRLVTAGGAREVLAQLTNRTSVYNRDPEDINSAGLAEEDLQAIGTCSVEPSLYGDLTFEASPPVGGRPADSFRIVYNLFNQVGWQHDAESGAYLRSQDRADGTGVLFPAVEALTGDQLAFENVLVLWARHRFVTPTIIEVELVYVRDRHGLLFRDGQVYEVRWSTPGGRLQVHDGARDPIPLKPGQTFFEIVSYPSTWNPEERIVRYHNPPGP